MNTSYVRCLNKLSLMQSFREMLFGLNDRTKAALESINKAIMRRRSLKYNMFSKRRAYSQIKPTISKVGLYAEVN